MNKVWWKEEVIYQIYPRSFKDSTGDGIGDLQGIISKLEYLQDLGVDIIWLGPVYDSPNDDNGYDIRDYYSIHPEFGTMEDFDELLSGLKQRGMRLVMDVVVNHSSDEHEWFVDARSSKDSPYRDYYIWRKPENGKEPNNWLSFFGGSAWEYEESTEEYYLHLFTKKQPDLNWENPELRKEVNKILKFWLDKGIDGFRMDVISLISKREGLPSYNYKSFNDLVDTIYANGPRVHEFLNDAYREVLGKYDIMTVGEGPGITKDASLDYVGSDRDELSMIFHLEHMFLGFGTRGRFDPVPYDWSDVKKLFIEWDETMGDRGWLSIFLDNHDFPRMVSRFGNDGIYRVKSAKLLAMLILSMRGTPCIYQGSEIGMTNVEFDRIDMFRDVETMNFYEEFSSEGMSDHEFIKLANQYGRDNVRTPMQWDGSSNAGFSQGEPWISVNPNFNEINVEAAIQDPDSILNFYKEMLRIRKSSQALKTGDWQHLDLGNEDLFAYTRTYKDEECLILLNHSDKICKYNLSHIDSKILVLSNRENPLDGTLKPWDCCLFINKNKN